ncbi:hypothetical protein AB0F52_32655 [Amycolatopsis sp. NPDC024027]|uniref:hypothetical protein n=1 Tax=Amycolatopsis sp. NPDC024027 TaxID=3154327 RepID=UPI003401BEB3
MTEIVPAGGSGEIQVFGELQRFEQMLLEQLANAGLPVDGVLVELEEREQALTTLGRALSRLPVQDRGDSYYVSKMIAAAAAGLFDAALNYLWNETVGELRRRVANYDLAYFYEIAVPSPDRRKHLSSVEDLTKVDDIDLLRAALQIGLLSTSGHAQLDHIRYMRNYASAAHPNQVELTGLQLAAWLETCIRQVITLPYDTITAETKRLLANVKAARIDPVDVPLTTAFFEDLPPERADSLAAGLFGLYVAADRTPLIADNVILLWPDLWPFVSEDARRAFGLRYGRFTASADIAQAKSARELLELVAGIAYLPEKELAVEIDASLDALGAAHHGFNNFHTEPAPARAVAALIGARGEVPAAVEPKYLRTLVDVFLGNQYGVSWAAETIYRDLVERLDTSQAGVALRSFMDPTISVKLWAQVGRQRWDALLDILEPKLTSSADRALMAAVRAFTGTPDKLASDSNIVRLAEAAAPRRRATPQRPLPRGRR